jgi:glycosyltransferase involved in cell wall biosynthesis
MIPTIYSWHPVLTPHQSHTLRALGDALGVPVRPVVAKQEDALRRGQGWAANDDSLLAPELLPTTGSRARIDEILDANPDAVHLFGSPFERSPVNAALYGVARRRGTAFLISEPYSPAAIAYLADRAQWRDTIKAWLRPLLYGVYAHLLRRRIAGVFAISPLAVEQYRAMGFAKVHPFGYFVPGDEVTPHATPADAPLNVAYLGSFIARKGVPTLLEAFGTESVRASGARLTLFGPENAAIRSIDAPNVRYGGALPFGAVQSALAEFDLLVVPSIYDGWAVVVNEAVQAGIPVLASDTVGAGAMLTRWNCGARFRAGDGDDLARLLAAVADDRGRVDTWRVNARRLAEVLEPSVAGAHMAACIKSHLDQNPSPEAPWY